MERTGSSAQAGVGQEGPPRGQQPGHATPSPAPLNPTRLEPRSESAGLSRGASGSGIDGTVQSAGKDSKQSPSQSQSQSQSQSRGQSQSQPQSQPQPQEPSRQPALRIRVLSLERRGRDLCIRLDAATNLAPYRRSHYPSFVRTYRELAYFALSLSVHVPSHILAALPLPSPSLVAAGNANGGGVDSSPNSMQQGRLLCYTLARWFARLTQEPSHRDHPETRNFVEADYSYHPLQPLEEYAPPLVRKRWNAVMAQAANETRMANGNGISIDVGAGLGLPNGVLATSAGGSGSSSGSSRGGLFGFGGSKSSSSSSSSSPSSSSTAGGKGLSLSRNVHDDDEDLVSARMEVTRLELQFNDASSKGNNVIGARGNVTTQLAALSNRLHTLAGVESTRPKAASLGLPDDIKTLADGLVAIDLTQQGISQTETLTILYQLAYQASNARSAKEALLARNALVEEHYEATKRALVKKREVEALKVRMGTSYSSSSGSGTITRDRIELAIQDFHEASQYAGHLQAVLKAMSGKMHESLRGHSRNAHADIRQALQEHAKGVVFNMRKEVQGLKALKGRLRGEAVAAPSTASMTEDAKAAVARVEAETEEMIAADQAAAGETSSPSADAHRDVQTPLPSTETDQMSSSRQPFEERVQGGRGGAPRQAPDSRQSRDSTDTEPSDGSHLRGQNSYNVVEPAHADRDQLRRALASPDVSRGADRITQSAFRQPNSTVPGGIADQEVSSRLAASFSGASIGQQEEVDQERAQWLSRQQQSQSQSLSTPFTSPPPPPLSQHSGFASPRPQSPATEVTAQTASSSRPLSPSAGFDASMGSSLNVSRQSGGGGGGGGAGNGASSFGFGSATRGQGAGRGGFGSGRGRGRITASEAARSLAGRF